MLEDSALEAKLAVAVLSDEHTCEVFALGSSVIERLAAGSAPNLLVLDWELPDMSGVEVCRFVRTLFDEVALPILVVTARTEGADVELAMAAGANDLIRKPYATIELRARVSSLVRLHQLGDVQVLEQQRLRLLVEASGVGLWELDVATEAITGDRRYLALMGRSAEFTPTLTTMLDAIVLGDRARVAAALAAALRGDHAGRVFEHFRTGGHDAAPLRWVEARARVQLNKAGQPVRIAGALVNITARKLAEVQREALIAALAAQPMLRVCVLRGPELVFEAANSTFVDEVARGRDLIGRPLLVAMPELAADGFAAVVREVLASGVPYANEESSTATDRGDGVLVANHLNLVCQPLLGSDGAIDGVLVLAHDITATVTARQVRALSEQQLQAVFELSPAAVCLVHGPDHHFVLANPRFLHLVGDRAVVGKSVVAALPELAAQRFVELLDGMRSNGAPIFLDELRLKLQRPGRVELEEVYLNVVYQPVPGFMGLEDSTLIHAIDVTAFVRAREQAHRLATERTALDLEVQSRAEFERQLIGIVSHDLRTPLFAISLGTDLLLNGDADARTLKTLMRIKSASDRGARMVNDLLDFTRARVGGGIPLDPQACNLHLLVRQAVEELETTTDRVLSVVTEGDAAGRWDADRMSQVVGNLISNALKYSTAGSTVDCTSTADATGVTVSVHNVGAPIEQAALAAIFQPMQRATAVLENKARSVGLGLYIVKHLVEAHGGHITVRSSSDAGTTFTFWVPKLAAPSAAC